MKKLFLLLLVAFATLGMGMPLAQAGDSDTFSITITCNYIDIVLQAYDGLSDYTTWAIGTQVENTPTTMTEAQGIKVLNNANMATDLSAWVSTQAAAWTNAAAAGANQYKLEMKCFAGTQATPDLSSATFTITSTATPGNDIKTNLAGNTPQWAYCKFTTPTSTTSGSQQTITVTVLSQVA